MSRAQHRQPWRGRSTRDVSGNLKQPMQYIPSVSRSSGIDKDGDALKDLNVQKEYRQFIQQKLDDIGPSGSGSGSESESGHKVRADAQENVMILFRKLREGLYASKRHDTFAVEVYETSLYLSILFNIPRNIPSVIPHLLSDLYPKNNDAPRQTITLLIALLHNLLAGFPSQISYRQTLADIPPLLRSQLLQTSSYAWLGRLSKALRTSDYVSIELLTRTDFVPVSDFHDDSEKALNTLVAKLRVRTRDRTWTILRSAYRELTLHAGAESREWLSHCLALPVHDLDTWIESQSALGCVRKKEGVEGRWIVVKPGR